MDYCTGLENRSPRKGTVSSNLTLSVLTKRLLLQSIWRIEGWREESHPVSLLRLTSHRGAFESHPLRFDKTIKYKKWRGGRAA